ncbi:MAG: RNB domain-containing ribonuclease [Oligosphaeraceae bacterium]|nr:RNB domain-containing ribonuclease [Oligosphaeraceae bacterium]
MILTENTLIDYFGNNEMSLALVLKNHGERLQVQGVDGKVSRINQKLVLVDYGKLEKDLLLQLPEILRSIQEKQTEIDLPLLWEELLPEAGNKLELADICNCYFGSAERYELSAMARTLIEDSLLFQRQGQQFVVRSREEVDELEELRRQRAEKAARRERQKAWLKQVFSEAKAHMAEVPDEMEILLRHSHEYLFNGFNSDTINILNETFPKRQARHTALDLLKNFQRLPADADEFLLVNGIHAGFSAEVIAKAEEIVALDQSLATWQQGLDLSDEFIFSIDDPETEEIDDALSFRRQGNRRFVGIHFAAPTNFVQKGDLLDETAAERPLSLYLPSSTVTMFPPQISCELASLQEGCLRPTLSFKIELNEQAEIMDWSLQAAKLKVSKRLSYDQVDQLLQAPPQDHLSEALHELLGLANQLCHKRETDGAVSLNRPELKIKVQDGEISVSEENQESDSYQIVREFMILANYLAAKYALRHEIPIIYRVQEPSSEPVRSLKGYDPLEFDQMVRRMKRTRLSTFPQAHFGLGLDLYTQVSAPIRRYADLVIQRQLAAKLQGEKPPYTQEELFAVLDNVEKTALRNRDLEREAKRHWLLEYLRREYMWEEMQATVIRLDGSLVLAELDKFYERGVVMTREKLLLGQRLNVRIIEANPQSGRLAMELA